MGGTRASPDDWDFHTTKATTGTARGSAASFKSRTLHDAFDPAKIKLRESRDSAVNPTSNALAIFLDGTGSMNGISDYMIRDGLGNLARELYIRKPVSDPHIMFGVVGDVAAGDAAPLQVTQFESDVQLVDQLVNFWLVNGGGANNSESYTLPWYFAAMKTSIDCFEKRGKKGYLFTIGDDGPPDVIRATEFARVFGPGEYQDMTAKQLYELVSRQYNVYHLLIEQGATHSERHVSAWTQIIGERAIRVNDYHKLAEVIISLIQINEGTDADVVTKSWSGDTSMVVAKAVGGLTKGVAAASGDVATF